MGRAQVQQEKANTAKQGFRMGGRQLADGFLSGAAGIGKTCFAEAHGTRPYVVRTLDQLKDVPGDCDLLVFDDMRFGPGGLELAAEERACTPTDESSPKM